MNISILTKSYNILAMLFCLAITLVAVFIFFYPINGYILQPPYTEQKVVLSNILVMVLAVLLSTPQPIALIGYYFAGGIDKRWFSHTLFVLLLFSLFVGFLTIMYLVFLGFTIIPSDVYGATVLPTDLVQLSYAFLAFLNLLFLPLTFTIVALVVKKVSVWQRLLPLISLVASFMVVFILATLLYGVAAATRAESLYIGVKSATIPQFIMLGSIAWALVGLVIFGMSSRSPHDNEN